MIFLVFPNYNIYSLPLFILIAQGYLFALLFIIRYFRKRRQADLFLALLLLMQGQHCFSYIIGFMDWYDTFQNTKVNYWLMNFNLIIGPLVFFYVKSVTNPAFKLTPKLSFHFLPFGVYFLYRMFLLMYDAYQPGYSEVQNGVLFGGIHIPYVSPFVSTASYISQVLYYAFSLQIYFSYREKLTQYFSNTYRLQLNWLFHFLLAWLFLFLFHIAMDVVNLQISNLHWTQKWWSYIASAVVILFLGIKGYFTNLDQLYQLTASQKTEKKSSISNQENFKEDVLFLIDFMKNEKPYLQPELTLPELAKQINWSTIRISTVLNNGLGKNFNDFVNDFRVEAVKQEIFSRKDKQFTLLAIAHECGFNSKSTFNRTFKKITQLTPSEFLSQHINQK